MKIKREVNLLALASFLTVAGLAQAAAPSWERPRTSAAGLTAAQLARVRINGVRALIDDSGYLTRRGMILLFR